MKSKIDSYITVLSKYVGKALTVPGVQIGHKSKADTICMRKTGVGPTGKV